MKTMRREICWLAVCVFVAAIAAVPLLALVNGRWASEAALGDVVISYDNVVRFYDNATGDEKDSNPSTPLVIDGISVPGNNFGIAFDGGLNLFVTNKTGTTSSVRRVSEETHQLLSPFTTQADPRSIVFAGNGDYFVASRTTTATKAVIRRYNSVGTQVGSDFEITVDSSGTCIGIDLDANQTTLYIVDGATGSQVTRRVRRLNVGSGSQSSLATALPGTAGAACAIRALPPVRGSNPTPGDPTAGGFLVADKVDIKQLGANGAQIGQGFDAGTTSPSDDNWMDVDLDPNSFDFWGLDPTQLIAAKFRIGSPPNALQPVISNLPTGARGLTVNGALRAAQTIRLLQQVTENNLSITTPAFNFGTDYAHTWQVKPETTEDVSAFLSVQAVEGTSDGTPAVGETATPANDPDGNGICPVSLDLDCRVFEFFRQTPAPPLVKPSPPAKKYSRNRAVFYNVTELQQTPVSSSVQLLIKVMRAVYASPGPGAACVPGGPTQPASSILRDKYPHTSSTRAGYSVFTEDGTILFGSLIKRTFNHYIAVDRQNTLYSAFMVKPTGDQNIGSTLQVAVEVRDPTTNCSVVSGLVESHTLAIAFLDVAALAIIADSEGVSTGVTTSGLQFVQAAGQYRANVTLTNPPFVVGRTYRACVTAKAENDPDNPSAQRAIGEVCSPNFKVLGKK